MHGVARLDARTAFQLVKPELRQLIPVARPQRPVLNREESALAGRILLGCTYHRGAWDQFLLAVLFDQRREVVILAALTTEGQRKKDSVLISLVLALHG